MQRVADGVERDVRREQDVVADMHRTAVQDGAAAVGVEMAAKADAAAVVAVKRRGDVDAFRQFAEKFGEQRLLCGAVARRDLRVVAPEQLAATRAPRFEVGVIGLVRRAAAHRFPGGAHQ